MWTDCLSSESEIVDQENDASKTIAIITISIGFQVAKLTNEANDPRQVLIVPASKQEGDFWKFLDRGDFEVNKQKITFLVLMT